MSVQRWNIRSANPNRPFNHGQRTPIRIDKPRAAKPDRIEMRDHRRDPKMAFMVTMWMLRTSMTPPITFPVSPNCDWTTDAR